MRTSRHFVCWIAAAALAAAALPLLAETPLKVGHKAPLFSTHDQDGNGWKLSRHIGKRLVLLYFYPIVNLKGKSDLKMKANARCEAPLVQAAKRRSNEKGLMSFLRSLELGNIMWCGKYEKPSESTLFPLGTT
jgi:glucose dehydrogenase